MWSKISFSFIASFFAVLFFGALVVRGGWYPTTATPPNDNAPEPLRVGPEWQQKEGVTPTPGAGTGSFGVNDLYLASINKWMSELDVPPPPPVPGCNWSGWKCDCGTNGSTGDGRSVIGFQCTSNRIANVKFLEWNVGNQGCPLSSAPSVSYCTKYSIFGVEVLARPTNLHGTPFSPPATFVQLNWEDNSAGEDYFYIQRSSYYPSFSSVSFASAPENATYYPEPGSGGITLLPPNQAGNSIRYFRVRAIHPTNPSLSSGWSNVLMVNYQTGEMQQIQ